MSVSTDDFRRELMSRFDIATNDGKTSIVVTASELHKSLKASQRHAPCCNAMKGFVDLENGDKILETPPSGKGGRLRICYKLPRVSSLLKPSLRQKQTASPTPARAKGSLLRNRVNDLIENFEECLNHFYAEAVFTGPCIYFHEKAIRIRNSYPTAVATLADEDFFDAVYATLTSWGMHKLGSKGAKLRDLKEIRQSFLDLSSDIETVQHLDLCDISDSDIELVGKKLRILIEKLKIGANSTILVPGTKAIHHLLPSLCPPIDRNYTLRFFYNQRQITRNEGEIFEEIFPEFHRIARSCKGTISRRLTDSHGMSSCQTKIIDNAIVGWVKREYGKEVTEETS